MLVKANLSIAPVLLGLTILVSAPTSAAAQARIPDEFTNLEFLPEDIGKRELIGIMRGFTRALGVGQCSTCHMVSDGLDQPDDDFSSDDKPLKVKARAMLRMVQAINDDHISQLEERGEPAFEVTCATCHAGKRRPTTLQQEVTWALEEGGVEAMTTRYAELRERYFGQGAYNFGSRTLQDVAQGLGRDNPEAAMAAIELNLEHYPESAASWGLKGQLHEMNGENDDAIEALEKSLELNPQNPPVAQMLERLKGGGD